MRQIIDNDYLTMLVRLVVGITFIWASIYKIIEPGDFAKSIWFYHMAPGNIINLSAIILPWLELICGVCIIFGIFYRGSIVWINVMMVVFIIALTSAVIRGLDIDCGCFKAAKSSGGSTLNSLLVDLGLIILTIQLWLSRSKKWMLSKS
ncbi:MAG: MauE/DoxX family redox-associated membrane protein [bacterium]